MSIESKYYKVKDGLDLDIEKEFLGVKNIKAYLILKELASATGSLDNKTMAKNCGMSLASYKEWKNHLVFCGLLQVRQLNAYAYVYCLGEDAIEKDDLMHEQNDYLSLAQELYGDMTDAVPELEEEEEDEEFVPDYIHEPVLIKKVVDIDKNMPMPNEDEIF